MNAGCGAVSGCGDRRISSGFTVTIPEVLELRRKYDLLELLLLDGEEKTLLWECAGDDLDELVKDNW